MEIKITPRHRFRRTQIRETVKLRHARKQAVDGSRETASTDRAGLPALPWPGRATLRELRHDKGWSVEDFIDHVAEIASVYQCQKCGTEIRMLDSRYAKLCSWP